MCAVCEFVSPPTSPIRTTVQTPEQKPPETEAKTANPTSGVVTVCAIHLRKIKNILVTVCEECKNDPTSICDRHFAELKVFRPNQEKR